MNGNGEPENLPSPSPPISPGTNAYNTLQIQKGFQFSQNIMAMFKPFFYPFFFVYGLFWGHRTFGPLRRGNTTKDWPQSQVSAGPEDDVGELDVPDDPGDELESLVRVPETEILLQGNTEIQANQVQPSQSNAKIPEAVMEHAVSDISRSLDNTEGDVYYLQSEPSSDSSAKKTKTITIALLCATNNDPLTTSEDTTNSDASSVINKNKLMERCVQFLDGYEPRCLVSRCDVDVFYHGKVLGEEQVGSSYTCCLLQYQLDWVERSERTIRISPHSVDLLD
jgi:hypothetical protein